MAIMRSPGRTKYISFPGQTCLKISGRAVWYVQGPGLQEWRPISRQDAADLLRALRRALRVVNAVRECAGVTNG